MWGLSFFVGVVSVSGGGNMIATYEKIDELRTSIQTTKDDIIKEEERKQQLLLQIENLRGGETDTLLNKTVNKATQNIGKGIGMIGNAGSSIVSKAAAKITTATEKTKTKTTATATSNTSTKKSSDDKDENTGNAGDNETVKLLEKDDKTANNNIVAVED